MICAVPHCRHPAVYAGVCIEHVQRPVTKRRLSQHRREAIERATIAIAEQDFPTGKGYIAHGAQGRGLLKGAVRRYIRTCVLATGVLPHGRHEIIWNEGKNCKVVDFDRLGEIDG